MPFPPINLHSRISSPGKELFRKKKPSSGVVPPPQAMLIHKPRAERDMEKEMEKEKEEVERERERERLGTSWPVASNNLKHLARKQQQQHQHHHQHHHQEHHQHHHPQHHQIAKASTDSVGVGVVSTDGNVKGGSSWVTVAKPLGSSCESVPRSSSGESAAAAASSSAAPRGSRHSSRASLGREEAGEQEVRFSLSLTPEAVLVIQKRNLEKQMLSKQQKCCGSADFRHRRVFPSKRAAQGGSKSSAAPGAGAVRPDAPSDISAIVKISLLNDQHKYDDVEYEEEDGDVDETVMRKCKEWLKGVESAAAFSKVDGKLAAALPHLKSC